MESPEGASRRPAPGAADHALPTDNVRRIAKLEEQQLQARSAGERVAGAVSRAAGNLLAEQESTATLRIVQSIALHLGVDPDACRLDADVSLSDETDLERLASRIDESVPEVPGLSEAAGARTAPAGSPPP